MLGTVAKGVVGAIPVVGGVAQGILDAKAAAQQRKLAGESPVQSAINGISDVLRPPLSGSNDRNAVGLMLLVGGAILVIVLLFRK